MVFEADVTTTTLPSDDSNSESNKNTDQMTKLSTVSDNGGEDLHESVCVETTKDIVKSTNIEKDSNDLCDKNMSDFVVLESDSQAHQYSDSETIAVVEEVVISSCGLTDGSSAKHVENSQHNNSSEIHLNEITITDSNASQTVEGSEHFYYVIDDDNLAITASKLSPQINDMASIGSDNDRTSIESEHDTSP